jgi:pyruvate formate lyase activating enzyme
LSLGRREFIRRGVVAGAGLVLRPPGLDGESPPPLGVHPAMFFETISRKRVVCRLCPNECVLRPGERGDCRVRENRDGRLVTLVYGTPCSAHIDPIEKKPLFHYHPGTSAFSIATAGCNMSCRFCQNWEISQQGPEEVRSISLSPQAVVRLARERGCASVAHTYGEPVVFYEYMLDCAREGRRAGIPNVMISNGYIQEEPMRELCRSLGAVKIDLKAFTDSFYREICGATLAPVLHTLEVVRDEGVWLEIVVLLIPGLNDSMTEIRNMTRWIVDKLGPRVPLHFSRFFPTYQLRNIPPTPPATLERAREVSRDAGLEFVYVGNLMSESRHTRCPACGAELIHREGFSARVTGLKGDRCSNCGHEIPGVFSP